MPETHASRLLGEWQELRGEIRAAQEAEHPDVTDKYGRVWTWVSRDLYRHDQLAWPLAIIESPHFGLPSPGLAANTNYHLCDICTQDWPNRRTPHG